MEPHTDPQDVADAFEATGFGWVLKMSDRDRILLQAASEIDEFREAHKERYGTEEVPDPFDLLEANSIKAATFFQSYVGVSISVDARVLVWRLILGEEIDSLLIDYQAGQEPVIRVFLHGDSRPFESNSLWDYQVFRNLGLIAIDGTPIFHGLYATV